MTMMLLLRAMRSCSVTNRTAPLVILATAQMWKGAKNELEYYNSMKMKMSILLGLLQVRVNATYA